MAYIPSPGVANEVLAILEILEIFFLNYINPYRSNAGSLTTEYKLFFK
jgi:hypothetical protein